MENHAFLIQTHSYPELTEEIVGLLESPNHYFFIHIDAKVKNINSFREICKKYQNAILIRNRLKVNWGGTSQFKATIELLKESFSYPIHIDYFHFISGQDFPCKSSSYIDCFFENQNKSYMFYDDPPLFEKYNNTRCGNHSYYLNDFLNYRNPYEKWLKGKLEKILSFVLPKRREIEHLRGGWCWFSWHRKVVAFVLDYLKANPSFIKRFDYTSCCDELFFHTLLYPYLQELDIMSNNSLRYIEWNPKRMTNTLPLILENTEYNDIMQSDAIFCRKIDPNLSKELIINIKKQIQ